MTASDPITAFLLARIAEDRAAAQAAIEATGVSFSNGQSRGAWTASGYGPLVWDDDAAQVIAGTYDGPLLEQAHVDHIVRQSPLVTLARCDADEMMIGEILAERHEVNEQDCWYTCAVATEERDGGDTCRPRAERPDVCDCGRDRRVGRRLCILAYGRRLRPDGTVHPDWDPAWDLAP